MKKILIALTVVSVLSITSIGYADRGDRHERQRVRTDHDSSAIVKLFYGFGGRPEYRGERHRPRHFEKTVYRERGPYGKRVVIKKRFYGNTYGRPYWKSVRYDRHRHDHDDRHDRFERDERRDRHRR